MSEFAGFDLDSSTSRAWRRFQARLADHVAEMGEGDTLVIDAEVADAELSGSAPYVQFAGFGEGTMVRGEVSSNSFLDARYVLAATAVEKLVELGWGLPTAGPEEHERDGSANFFVDLPPVEADRLAVMAVRALREVFGVAHPAFLDATGLGSDPDEAASPSLAEDLVAADEPIAVMPDSAEHLVDLVDAALTPLFGAAPERDADGDIPVPWGSSLVFVRVDEEMPVVQLFSIVVEGVQDLERAAFEVGVLNRDDRFIKFFLADDRVVARVHLPAWPFVPEHLRSMLTGMSAKIDEIDEDLVARVGGRRAFDSDDDGCDDGCDDGDDDSDDVDVRDGDDGDGDTDDDAYSAYGEEGADEAPGDADGVTGGRADRARDASRRGNRRPLPTDETVLMTLLELDAESSGTIEPDLAAGVCGYDQELVVRLLGETERQEVAWTEARDSALRQDDGEQAAACEHELQAWERTTRLLRRSLRLVVERELGRDTTAGSSYTSGADPRAPRPSHPGPATRLPRRLETGES